MELIETDLKHVWHPASQMKDYEIFPPLPVLKAKGGYLELVDGRRIFDAISSWWCKSLGHGHPRLQKALVNQMNKFEHIMLANTTYDSVVKLSQKLASWTSSLDRVFFASDGACAVEIAVKMALQAQSHRGNSERNQLMALNHSYHGETLMASALTDIPVYRKSYEGLMPSVHFLQSVPYVDSKASPLWENCEVMWPRIEAQLNAQASHLAAIIVEPLLQGASGMRLYSKDFLHRLKQWCQLHQVYLIADEIMTGCGRLGKPLACQLAQVEPDFICLGKGLTAGYLPLSAVLTSSKVYHLFYDDYQTNKSFLHSHTYSGNALACAVAFEALTVLEEEGAYEQAEEQEKVLIACMLDVQEATSKIQSIRGLGAVVAADLVLSPQEAVKQTDRWGYRVYQEAVKRGVFLRPLGNTLYWLPPLNTSHDDLIQLRDVTIASIKASFASESF